ncbi:MAG: hypothetical protein GX418_02915 [Clostridiales bacterium]|nr:hypothetical protein [Clostridiales bacterium]
MQIRFNPLQAASAGLAILSYCVFPFLYFGIPGIRIPLYGMTALQFWYFVSDWMILPLILAVVMLAASLIRDRVLTVVTGGLAMLGTIVLGACLGPIIAGSGLTRLINSLASRASAGAVNLTPVISAIGTAAVNVHYGFFLYLLFCGLFLLFGLARIGENLTGAGGYGGGYGGRGAGGGARTGGGSQYNMPSKRRESMYH